MSSFVRIFSHLLPVALFLGYCCKRDDGLRRLSREFIHFSSVHTFCIFGFASDRTLEL